MRKINFRNRKTNKTIGVLIFCNLLAFNSIAQKNVRIGYIDTEYILQNVPEYQQAKTQLNDKVKNWQQEIEKKLGEIEQMKIDLSNEKVFLTKELIAEKEEDIQIEEQQILEYQQKLFGPNGDLMMQKKRTMQPVQDQIFAAVQEIGSSRNYDYIFDKSADVVMLYSNRRYDISDQVLQSINRSSKRRQATSRSEKRAAENEDVVPELNEEKDAREKAAITRKEARKKELEERRKKILESRAAKKRELEEKRKKALEKRAKSNEENTEDNFTSKEEDMKAAAEEKLSRRESRKKELEEKRKKVLERRAKAKAAEGKQSTELDINKKSNKDEYVNETTVDEDDNSKGNDEPLDMENKLSDKESRKRALEDKKKKALEAREKARIEKLEARRKKLSNKSSENQEAIREEESEEN